MTRLKEKMVATIRLANAHEASDIGELTERAYREEGFLNVEGSEEYAEQLRDAAERIKNATVLVAEMGGRIVATVHW